MDDLRAGTNSNRSSENAIQDAMELCADAQSQTYNSQRLEYLIDYYEGKIYSYDDLQNKVDECQEEWDNLKNYKGRASLDRNWVLKYNVLAATLYRLDGMAHFYMQKHSQAKSKHDLESDIAAYEYIEIQYQEAMEYLDDCEQEEGSEGAVAPANLKFQMLRLRVHQVVALAYYSLRLLEHGNTCGALQKGRIAVGELQSIEEGRAQLVRENLVPTNDTAFQLFIAFLEVAQGNVDDVVKGLTPSRSDSSL
ncbi:hypothetical protein H072_7714 [Dactylellina haptotyla CBS 200.50]|uniref:Uncharacterized protein n=1 Tax=Dactylellina haptotyla (strain CBS 200.50) TaxID=1284197 RepID=S8BGW1_DACHA|nr:hypothetical protein H072_7714 [Dactylellina haptotyla CBS 200.50]